MSAEIYHTSHVDGGVRSSNDGYDDEEHHHEEHHHNTHTKQDATSYNDPSEAPLEEDYWMALLNEGEYARTHMPPNGQEFQAENYDAPDRYEPINHVADDGMYDDGMYDTAKYAADAYTSFHEDWDNIAAIKDNDARLSLKVIGYNRGGLLVEWRNLRGFVPASQLVNFPISSNIHERHQALINRVGDTLQLRVIELDADKNRLILSERAAQVESGTRAEILRNLDSGTVVTGRITNLCDFGAFVDLGGVEGLIHISELSWGRVGHPADILTRGQQIEVFVLDVDPDESRVALSLKRLNADPWATVHERYAIGEVVEGKITNVVDFGAFACIEEGLEGLIHFSELAEGHFLHPRNVVAEGDIVHARILSIDGRARRLGLSLRNQ